MIFVMLGTNPYPFERLLKAVAAWASSCHEKVIAQVGHTGLRPPGLECHDFVPHAQIEGWIGAAELVITQGGFGSLRDCLVGGKPTIAVPRIPEYGESQDRQAEIVDVLAEEGRVIALYDMDKLPQAIEEARRLRVCRESKSEIPVMVKRAVESALSGR